MEVKLLSYTNNPYDVMWISARTCYSEGDASTILPEDKNKIKSFVHKVLSSGHLSIAEHVSFTFLITGISRACSHQLVRHRHCTFSQQSQRYVRFDNGFEVAGVDLENKDIKNAIDVINSTYKKLLKDGFKSEDARVILPNCCSTNIVMTCNLRQLSHICGLRLCTRAQKEIRLLFNKIKQQVKLVDEDLSNLLEPQCESLGYCPEHNSCGRKDNKEE